LLYRPRFLLTGKGFLLTGKGFVSAVELAALLLIEKQMMPTFSKPHIKPVATVAQNPCSTKAAQKINYDTVV